MNIVISSNIQAKLKTKHGVTRAEVEQCFLNRRKGFLEDTRERHRTHPPTEWFIAETDHGRQLKVVFVEKNDGKIHLKTAYEPDLNEVDIYERFA